VYHPDLTFRNTIKIPAAKGSNASPLAFRVIDFDYAFTVALPLIEGSSDLRKSNEKSLKTTK
jgi:hypothetical protein